VAHKTLDLAKKRSLLGKKSFATLPAAVLTCNKKSRFVSVNFGQMLRSPMIRTTQAVKSSLFKKETCKI
jgi:hypothetical protein